MSANGQNSSQPADGYNKTESAPLEPTKDEVGWYFVEKYYNTLSASPEKLHLFYGKHSQFIYGEEAELSKVIQGRAAIEERIRQLDFQDCKVRVSNVDSVGSFDNIVIQVIGETSNKQEAPRKFVQTFVLAQQDKGYFVLNDIWRFITEEDEVDVEQPTETGEPVLEAPADVEVPAATEPEPVVEEPTSAVPVPVEEPIPEPVAEPEVEELVVEEPQEPEPEPVEEEPQVPEPVKEEIKEEVKEDEKPVAEPVKSEAKKPTATAPKEEETPAPLARPAPKAPEPAPRPAAPAVPMTWASRAAAAAAAASSKSGSAAAAVATPKAAATPTAAAASKAASTPATKAAPQAAAPTSAQPGDASASEWQTAGSDSKRQNRPQSTTNGSTDKDTVNAYVKSVSDKVSDSDLRNALSAYGQVTYCDINRTKNCAFVDFANMDGFKAAANANPHIINGESISIELRKPKSGSYGSYGGSGYNGRGGMGRGRGGFDGGRGNYGRGGFRGGRGGGAPRGRGPQVANA